MDSPNTSQEIMDATTALDVTGIVGGLTLVFVGYKLYKRGVIPKNQLNGGTDALSGILYAGAILMSSIVVAPAFVMMICGGGFSVFCSAHLLINKYW